MNQPRLGFPPSFYVLLALGAVAAVIPFSHVLGGLYNVWNLKPEYSHGFIIPIISAFLVWRQREEIRQMPFTGSWYGLALIAAGLGLRLVGELTTMHTLEHYAFLLVIYGLVLALTGPVVFRRHRRRRGRGHRFRRAGRAWRRARHSHRPSLGQLFRCPRCDCRNWTGIYSRGQRQ